MSAMLAGEENAKADVESGIYETYRKLVFGDRVLDLGANVGYFTQHASNIVGSEGLVIAFEPDPENFTRLVERTRYCINVGLVRAGAMDIDGLMNLYHLPGNCGGHSYFPGPAHSNNTITSVVNIGRWARMLQPTFVKIDTEGSELRILRSMLNHNIEAHYTYEVHNDNLYHDCRSLLEERGYAVYPKDVVVGVCWAVKL